MYDDFYFDNFFDLPEKALPQNCEYYFNVLMIEVEVPTGELAKVANCPGLWEFTDMSRIKNPRPICIYYYESDDAHTWNIDTTPHTVVEFNTKTREMSWYDMLEFETESPWAIDPIEEDFDYDDDDDNPENWDDDDHTGEAFDDENDY